jgi:hypothetical protein
MKSVGRIIKLVVLFQMVAVLHGYGQSSKSQVSFENRDRMLLKAMDSQNDEPWRMVITPDFVFITEASEVIHAPEFLHALAPSAGGESVPAPEMRDYSLTVTGKTAIVVFFLWETGEHLGSPLTGHSIVTETWQRLGGRWKLRIIHMTSVPVPPPAVKLTMQEMQELKGKYKAATTVQIIRLQGDRLLLSTDGGVEHEVKAEACDVLFTSKTPRMRMVFQRDSSGRIIGFAYRNENRSVYFHRIDP